jgi:hypothetical protein
LQEEIANMSKQRCVWILLSALLITATVAVAPAPADEIDIGLDLYATVAVPGAVPTYVDLSILFGPLFGRVELQGVPFARDLGFGNTDTIIFRQAGIERFPVGGEGEVPIELIALNLRSVRPIEVGGIRADLWVTLDTYGLFPDRLPQERSEFPSVGLMTVRHEQETGGSYSPTLFASPHFTLTRVGGSPVEPNDVLFSAEIPYGYIDPLRAERCQWSHRPAPGYPDLFSGGFYPAGPCRLQSRLAAHMLTPAVGR